jgi:hypothetical protein
MKFLKIALIVLLSLVALAVLVGFCLPSAWRVERSAVINAPPAAIYPLVADFKTGWPQWSAFDQEDPTIRYTYSGPDQGAGAERTWVSEKMGNGGMKITKSDPETGIEFELTMERGFRCNGKIAFARDGERTTVTWTDWGDVGSNLPMRYLMPMMDSMLGKAFEKSLAKLEEKAEAERR